MLSVDDGAVGMIEAVNARAGLLCEVRTPSLLAAVDKALDRLVAAYEDHPNNNIEDQSTPLGQASVEFWQALRGARGARLQGLRHRSLA